MTNFYDETLTVLLKHGKQTKDVCWVGARDGAYSISWAKFVKLTRDVEYENRLGKAKIALDLVVVGEDWWLERNDFDGSEWWEYKERPIAKSDTQPFRYVKGSYGNDTIADYNK